MHIFIFKCITILVIYVIKFELCIIIFNHSKICDWTSVVALLGLDGGWSFIFMGISYNKSWRGHLKEDYIHNNTAGGSWGRELSSQIRRQRNPSLCLSSGTELVLQGLSLLGGAA